VLKVYSEKKSFFIEPSIELLTVETNSLNETTEITHHQGIQLLKSFSRLNFIDRERFEDLDKLKLVKIT